MAADLLARECLTYSRYLAGSAPDEYVRAKYRDAIGKLPDLAPPTASFERLLLSLSRRPWLVRAVDAYARFFCPGAMVRRRLVLLFAMLESNGKSAQPFERADSGGLPMFVLRAGLSGLWVLCLLLASALVLLPLQRVLGTR